MGGTIEVRSKMNQGSEFKITLELPLLSEDSQTSTKNENHTCLDEKYRIDYDFSGIHILLCEDNQINQQIAVRLLELEGAEVEVACNGKEAVELFLNSELGEFSIILMDIRMPIMDGIEATKAIRTLEREDADHIPIVAMTANALDEEKKECLNAGMNGHLMKPIDFKAMCETIENQIKKENVN